MDILKATPVKLTVCKFCFGLSNASAKPAIVKGAFKERATAYTPDIKKANINNYS